MKLILIVTTLFLASASYADQKLTFGRFQSRAIFNAAVGAQCPAPIVVMEPGSGPNGPEEMIPGELTLDGHDQPLFNQFAEGMRRGHVATLQVGKPGIDFFKGWGESDILYDKDLYVNMSWQDLIDNLFDAVTLAKTLPCVDVHRIYIFGHSEGTQVAVDFAHQHPEVKGLIMSGYSGEALATTVDWQLFRRVIDSWLEPDVDVNHDQIITLDEVKSWPEFVFPPGVTQMSFAEIEATARADQSLQDEVTGMKSLNIWKGVFDRAPIYKETAELPQDIFIFTGSVDTQTRPEEALRAKDACAAVQKQNCHVQIVDGLTHGMSQLKGPRKQKLLDATLGPVDESFENLLQAMTSSF